MKRKNLSVLLDVLFFGAIILFIGASFFTFMRSNSRRILEQNNSFIESVTEQTGNRINDLISMAQSNVEIMGHLYGAAMPRPEVDSEMLQEMTEQSPFDYVEFISQDGIDLTADGRTADLKDREYFLDGMAGNSGKCVVYNSRITHETLMIFYTPFYFEDEIIGVLSGIMRGDTVYEILTSSYFGVQASSYLLERNGNVIISAGDETNPENLLDTMTAAQEMLSDADRQKLLTALAQGTSTSFNYNGAEGAGSAYITALQDGDWMLAQYFPSSLTRSMSRNANSAGIWLEIRLIAAFLCYLLYLILKNQSQKRRLVSENQEISRIVDAITLLFTRFSLVDLENDTYEYLEKEGCSAPQTGTYSDLVRYLDAHYLPGEGGEKMSRLISGDYVQEHLTEDVPYLQWEYEIDMEGHRWENISVLCLKRKNGVPVRVLYAIQDVTALKEEELQIRTALKNASAAAEAANHAKSDFLARMSHDIRTARP